MKWQKEGADQWVCRVAPDARFTLKAAMMGDGRWAWKVFSGTTVNPMATGIVSSLGAAKHAMENFLKKAGYV